MIAVGLGRGLRAICATRGLVAQWLPGAEAVSLRGAPAPAFRIRHAFPAVCVVGIRRPRLFVAGQVVDALTAAELAAVLTHEAGHLAAHDNLKGLLLGFAIDPLAWCRSGEDLDQAWRDATEASADHAVSCGSRRGCGLDLASALVKVARLAPPSSRLALPVPALHDGEDLADRVRRLLEPPVPAEVAEPRARRSTLIGGSAVVIALSAAVLPAALRSVHAVLELLVRYLP
jgi:beta-lactamase regulating signal transducer with metallopeptidase domain